jgi:hypothetical protein
MLVKNGIQVEEDDVYCMMLPGETDGILGVKKAQMKKGSLRSPFLEGHAYDNSYEFQHMQKSENPNSAELNFPLTCQ